MTRVQSAANIPRKQYLRTAEDGTWFMLINGLKITTQRDVLHIIYRPMFYNEM